MSNRSVEALRALLSRVDGRGYKAYKELRGTWDLPTYPLTVDHVQGDPFAAPSRLRVVLDPSFTGLPEEVCRPASRALGTACLLARRFTREARSRSAGTGTGKSGEIGMESPGQEVLPQTAVRVGPDGRVEARFTLGLPARGRTVLGGEATRLLLEAVPAVITASLRAAAYAPGEILLHARTNEDAQALRAFLAERELVAFVADGALLPRRTGVSQEPLEGEKAVLFHSPDSLRVEAHLPNAGPVTGMGIPRGVTLIVGGGYHGKSTLLRALERGVYNHRPGDGRERVVSDEASVKIRAEDGRSVQGVDISPFIRNLPTGEETRTFGSPNASGSTSQAANIMESVEAGASVLLVDEDTAATNFMIRDRRMQALVPRESEPITPFIDRVRQLHEDYDVSSVLVLGGSGDYLDVADTVIAMNGYRPAEVTERARQVAASLPTGRVPESTDPLVPRPARVPLPSSLDPRKGRHAENLRIRSAQRLVLGHEEVDLSGVDQIVSWSQAQSVGRALLLAWRDYMDGKRTLPEILDAVQARIEAEGLDVLDSRMTGELTAFRRFELAAALNRLRSLTCAPLNRR